MISYERRQKDIFRAGLTAALTMMCLLYVLPAASARTITVDANGTGDYPTIQLAINRAVDGDIVIVAPGTYTGVADCDIDFEGKAITVRSIDPNDPNIVAATIVDCNASESDPHRGFYFHSGEGPDSIISGLTIKNGYICDDLSVWYIWNAHAYGGGIYCSGSSPTIKNCVIANNRARGREGFWGNLFTDHPDLPIHGGNAYGGGIYCTSNSSPTIENCVIANNTARGLSKALACAGLYYVAVEGGNAYGGGIYCTSSSNPAIINCTISDNHVAGGDGIGSTLDWNASGGGGAYGAGIYSDLGSNLTLQGCSISGNTALGGDGGKGHYTRAGDAGDAYGAGICCGRDGTATINNCTVSNNQATGGIGGTGEDCDPAGRSGYAYGGGVCCDSNSISTIDNCVISRNITSGGIGGRGEASIDVEPALGGSGGNSYGGSIYYNSDSVSTVENCLISGNTAVSGHGGGAFTAGEGVGGDGGDAYCGGMYCAAGSKITILNCTIIANRVIAEDGGTGQVYGATGSTYEAGLYCEPDSIEIVTDCIVWGNYGQAIYGGEPNVTYCDVEGGWPGKGNIDVAPCFISTGYWVRANDANIIVEPNDRKAVLVMCDYHLQSQAGRWDPNSPSWIQDDVTSPCIDAGDPNSPIGYEPFPNGGIINMGAYGGTAEASKSYFGEPICETIAAGDINGDCKVDSIDFAIMAAHWLENNRL
jgi:hypothetical protein